MYQEVKVVFSDKEGKNGANARAKLTIRYEQRQFL